MPFCSSIIAEILPWWRTNCDEIIFEWLCNERYCVEYETWNGPYYWWCQMHWHLTPWLPRFDHPISRWASPKAHPILRVLYSSCEEFPSDSKQFIQVGGMKPTKQTSKTHQLFAWDNVSDTLQERPTNQADISRFCLASNHAIWNKSWEKNNKPIWSSPWGSIAPFCLLLTWWFPTLLATLFLYGDGRQETGCTIYLLNGYSGDFIRKPVNIHVQPVQLSDAEEA